MMAFKSYADDHVQDDDNGYVSDNIEFFHANDEHINVNDDGMNDYQLDNFHICGQW